MILPEGWIQLLAGWKTLPSGWRMLTTLRPRPLGVGSRQDTTLPVVVQGQEAPPGRKSQGSLTIKRREAQEDKLQLFEERRSRLWH